MEYQSQGIVGGFAVVQSAISLDALASWLGSPTAAGCATFLASAGMTGFTWLIARKAEASRARIERDRIEADARRERERLDAEAKRDRERAAAEARRRDQVRDALTAMYLEQFKKGAMTSDQILKLEGLDDGSGTFDAAS